VNSCAFCGRANDDGSQFCIDCGKSLQPSSAARAISTAAVANLNQTAAPPFTPVSAPAPARTSAAGAAATAASAGLAGVAACPHCGSRVADAAEPAARPSGTATYEPRRASHKVVVLGPAGETTQTHVLDRGELLIGRSGGDVRFPDDVYMSPLHAHLAAREGGVAVRDLGSRNGTWVFIDGPCRLQDGDTILVGSQLLRFRRLGYPGPHPPEADATRRPTAATGWSPRAAPTPRASSTRSASRSPRARSGRRACCSWTRRASRPRAPRCSRSATTSRCA